MATPEAQSIVITSLAAAADAGLLDERGIPKKLGRQFRKMEISAYDKESHTVTMAVSSETPVERYFGQEILSHQTGAIRLGRLKNGIALLFNHDMDQHLGRSESYKLRDDGVLEITNRFGGNPLALEKEGDVESRILVDVSIAYQVYEWEITEDKNGVRTYLAVDWEILENSLVTVPADPTVGVGRSAKDDTPVKVRSFRKLSDDEEGDPEDDEDDDEEDDPEDETDTGSDPAPRSKIPAAKRTITMAEQTTTAAAAPAVTQVVDHAALNLERVNGLRSLNKAYPEQFNERSLKAAEELGVSVESAKERVANAVIDAAQRNNVATISDEVFGGMTDKDLSRYTLAGAYRAAANKRSAGTFQGADLEGGFEREVGEELTKRASAAGINGLGAGIPAPSFSTLSAVRAQRAIASGGNAGASTNFTVVNPDPIELLRNRTVLLAMGARMLTGLHGAVQMTKQTGAGTSNWELEGGVVPNTDPTLGFFTMKPNRLSIQNSYYRDFLAQSALSIDSFLADDRLQVLARALDTAGLVGSGVAPVPLGLLNQPGIAAVLAGSTRAANGTVTNGAGGVPMTFVDYNNLEGAISSANADIGTMGIITTPKVRASGRSTPQIPGTASGFVWPTSKVGANGIQEGPLGYNSIVSSNAALTGFTANAVPNLHAVLMGVFDQILFGDWGLSEVIADPYTGAAQALFKFTEHAYYDINVRHIEAFAVCTSALPS